MSLPLSRRGVIGGAATLGVGVPLLAACGGEDDAPTAVDPSTAGSESPAPSAAGEASSSAAPAGLVAAADVPVGGGVVVEDAKVVVTQPSAGEYKAYTAVCTHTGCLVSSVRDGEIICPCHGSRFSTSDGSVISGPAGSPLSSVAVSVDGDQVVRS